MVCSYWSSIGMGCLLNKLKLNGGSYQFGIVPCSQAGSCKYYKGESHCSCSVHVTRKVMWASVSIT